MIIEVVAGQLFISVTSKVIVCVPTFDKLIVAGFDEEVVIGAAGLIDQFILFDTKSVYIVLSDT